MTSVQASDCEYRGVSLVNRFQDNKHVIMNVSFGLQAKPGLVISNTEFYLRPILDKFYSDVEDRHSLYNGCSESKNVYSLVGKGSESNVSVHAMAKNENTQRMCDKHLGKSNKSKNDTIYDLKISAKKANPDSFTGMNIESNMTVNKDVSGIAIDLFHFTRIFGHGNIMEELIEGFTSLDVKGPSFSEKHNALKNLHLNEYIEFNAHPRVMQNGNFKPFTYKHVYTVWKKGKLPPVPIFLFAQRKGMTSSIKACAFMESLCEKQGVTKSKLIKTLGTIEEFVQCYTSE